MTLPSRTPVVVRFIRPLVQVYRLPPLSSGDSSVIIEDWSVPLDSVEIGPMTPAHVGDRMIIPFPYLAEPAA